MSTNLREMRLQLHRDAARFLADSAKRLADTLHACIEDEEYAPDAGLTPADRVEQLNDAMVMYAEQLDIYEKATSTGYETVSVKVINE